MWKTTLIWGEALVCEAVYDSEVPWTLISLVVLYFLATWYTATSANKNHKYNNWLDHTKVNVILLHLAFALFYFYKYTRVEIKHSNWLLVKFECALINYFTHIILFIPQIIKAIPQSTPFFSKGAPFNLLSIKHISGKIHSYNNSLLPIIASAWNSLPKQSTDRHASCVQVTAFILN